MHSGDWKSRGVYRCHAVAARRLAGTFSDVKTVRDLLNFAALLEGAARAGAHADTRPATGMG